MATPEEEQIQLSRIGNVCIITFTGKPHKANVFTMALLKRLDALLDQVEDQHMPCSLVFTGSGRFFSAGFDLQALTGTPHNSKQKSSSSNGAATSSQDLVNFAWLVLARILIFPAPTFALFNGHAFGLGLFLGLACDHRWMVNDKKKAFLCLPEINIGLPLGFGFAALARCKLNKSALKIAALTGKQIAAQEALELGMIDAILPPSNGQGGSLPQEILERAEKLVSTSEKGNLKAIKMEIYGETYSDLLAPTQKRSKL
ncbi:Fatty acid oxidation complex subunit alpha [Seminavis robusta]|uniref:Fatty acid oxidation complex subunit alpha n=1 Tax=Seminavis robusta TaxID=568900 RepID=A0A9N8HMD2_9STRA|nr:Fatty acid oxidation complex subunit alpha [Seminavis robusta]|eukprot:Sro1105_g241920.1 Fatty acid oxidation complex subunit alpha (258) ;mRNA; r:15899-16672